MSPLEARIRARNAEKIEKKGGLSGIYAHYKSSDCGYDKTIWPEKHAACVESDCTCSCHLARLRDNWDQIGMI